MQIPKFISWIVGPIYGVSRKFVIKNVGIKIKFDNSYSKKCLNISYIPIEQTVKDQFEQLIKDGLIKKAE